MISGVKTLPPGSSQIWAVELDELGNEVYVGGPIIVNPVTNEPEPTPVQPAYNTPPRIRPTEVKTLDVVIKDGFTIITGDPQSLELVPSLISGWDASEAAKKSDDVNAFTSGPQTGYSSELVLSGFNVEEIPNDSVITGIRVTVERSKI